MFEETVITINGSRLSKAQSMAVWVALNDFKSKVAEPDQREMLGEIADLYRDRLREVLQLILES